MMALYNDQSAQWWRCIMVSLHNDGVVQFRKRKELSGYKRQSQSYKNMWYWNCGRQHDLVHTSDQMFHDLRQTACIPVINFGNVSACMIVCMRICKGSVQGWQKRCIHICLFSTIFTHIQQTIPWLYISIYTHIIPFLDVHTFSLQLWSSCQSLKSSHNILSVSDINLFVPHCILDCQSGHIAKLWQASQFHHILKAVHTFDWMHT